MRPPEAFITDPLALLAAMAAADQAEHEAVPRRRPCGETRHTSCLVAPLQAHPEPVVAVLPALREDERFGRRSENGVVVIIRRRRAA